MSKFQWMVTVNNEVTEWVTFKYSQHIPPKHSFRQNKIQKH